MAANIWKLLTSLLASTLLISSCNAEASPKGRIVFVVPGPGLSDVSNLFVIDTDGKNLFQLTNSQAQNSLPDWSPDGKRIAFSSNQDGNEEIYIINADGTGQVRLTFSTEDEGLSGFDHDIGPTWSPDGEWIAFSSNRAGNFDIYIMKPDGSEQTQLTFNPNGDIGSTWSPDGKLIGFTSTREAGLEVFYPNSEPYIMDIDGSNQVNPFGSWRFSGPPLWSSEGSIVVLNEPDVGVPVNVFSRLVVLNLETDEARRLTMKYDEVYGQHSEYAPSWSPDGQWITFLLEGEICIIRVSGDDLTCLVKGTSPDWGP